jgi:hypothetical protein
MLTSSGWKRASLVCSRAEPTACWSQFYRRRALIASLVFWSRAEDSLKGSMRLATLILYKVGRCSLYLSECAWMELRSFSVSHCEVSILQPENSSLCSEDEEVGRGDEPEPNWSRPVTHHSSLVKRVHLGLAAESLKEFLRPASQRTPSRKSTDRLRTGDFWERHDRWS